MTPKREAELRQSLKEMQTTSDAFYAAAVRIGVHPFIEFCGLMNEYILACEQALNEGIDFSETSRHSSGELKIQGHMADYIGEKFGCIFGNSLQNPKVWNRFVSSTFSEFGGTPPEKDIARSQ